VDGLRTSKHKQSIPGVICNGNLSCATLASPWVQGIFNHSVKPTDGDLQG
jgi:hypothetical protein